ncbi:hypothetical protein GCM10022252_45480 [Streptosporangium oxazolinicum]|uniref:TIGR04500 family peptide maturation system protein n=1 Tax=Streptosporangium oxazolinicum TaxID=909287 RepID=A0ABP8B393_9ACTN
MKDYPQTLASAVELLRGLPRNRDSVRDARSTATGWIADHPGSGAQLVVDVRPGTPIVDYDLLLDHPDGGTIAISAPADDGVPWAIDHSHHWAAGTVLTVDGQELQIPTALLSMRSYAERHRLLLDDLIDYCVLLLETRHEPDPTQAELQSASDGFRRRRGLHNAEDMRHWLDEVGLTTQAYENHIYSLARSGRFRARKEAELAAAHFAAHTADFDRVAAVWAVGPGDALALLAEHPDPVAALTSAISEPSADLAVHVADRTAVELPEPLRTAGQGACVGPLPFGEAFLFGVVRRRHPAEPNQATLAAAGRAAFTAYMTMRRATAKVDWNWL